MLLSKRDITEQRLIEFDERFMVAVLLDEWVRESHRSNGKTAVTAEGTSATFRGRIVEHGFADTWLHFRKKADTERQIAHLVSDVDALEALCGEIQDASPIPEYWARRLMAVGCLPELRVYDLRNGEPVDPCGVEGEPVPWPSSLCCQAENDKLHVTVRGLREYEGRSARCALLPYDKDDIFTRMPVPTYRRPEKPIEHGRFSAARWQEVAEIARASGHGLQSADVSDKGEMSATFGNVTEASPLSGEVFVVALNNGI